ncbi:MAG: cell division protein FtsL [Spirochaetota bacterium]|jgi:cell division protein FtsL|nr:cell division protein FtsL [Spirochaetota bacterium]
MIPRAHTHPEEKSVLRLCLRVLCIVLLVMSVLFLFLMQRIKSRELDQEIARLKQEQAEAIKNLNQLDWRIEQLKSPERIKSLAQDVLGMQERERK